MISAFDSRNELITQPGENQCNNCHAYLSAGDLYCRECGTKRGEGVFVPYRNVIQTLYGPCPIDRIHKCETCGHSWTTCAMIEEEPYCPKCGSKTLVICEDAD